MDSWQQINWSFGPLIINVYVDIDIDVVVKANLELESMSTSRTMPTSHCLLCRHCQHRLGAPSQKTFFRWRLQKNFSVTAEKFVPWRLQKTFSMTAAWKLFSMSMTAAWKIFQKNKFQNFFSKKNKFVDVAVKVPGSAQAALDAPVAVYPVPFVGPPPFSFSSFAGRPKTLT